MLLVTSCRVNKFNILFEVLHTLQTAHTHTLPYRSRVYKCERVSRIKLEKFYISLFEKENENPCES